MTPASRLTEHLNWRWTLYVNLAFAAIGLIGAAAFLRRGDRPTHRPKIDLPGTALVSAGLFLLVFGLSRAQVGGWHAPASWLSLTGAAALLAAFAGWQARAAAPLLPLRVLADRDRGASIIALTLASAGIYSVFLGWSLSVRSAAGRGPRQSLQPSGAIRQDSAPPWLSTIPQPRLSTIIHGADQHLRANHPQAYAQIVILAGQEAAGNYEPEKEDRDVALRPSCSAAEGDPHALRLLAKGGPGHVFAAPAGTLRRTKP